MPPEERLLSPAEIATQVTERSLDFLEADWRDVAERQHSMRATFDHSWRLLDEREQALFADLAVFRGGFSYEAARHVSGVTLRELMALMAHSLLERATVPLLTLSTGRRYQVHELLRQYGEEKLDGRLDGGRETRDRHAAYYIALLGRWSADLDGPLRQALLDEIQTEIDNVRAAWQWAIARRRVEWLAQGIEGTLNEAERLARESIDLSEGLGDQQTLAFGLLILTWISVFCGRYAQALAAAEESLALCGSLGSRHTLCHTLIICGEANLLVCRYGQARDVLQQRLALSREMAGAWETGLALRSLGELTLAEDRLEDAARFLQDSVEVLRGTAHRVDASWPCAWLAVVAIRQGEIARAQQNLAEALRTAVQGRDFLVVLHALPAAALLMVAQARGTRAVELWALASRHPHVARSPVFDRLVGQPVAALAAHLDPEAADAARERGRASDLWATLPELLAELEA